MTEKTPVKPASDEVVIHGIKNCDTMKKAFAWLAGRGVAYRFHDYRRDGLDADMLAAWCAKLGWRALLNTRGTTWRKLDPAQQAVDTEQAAIALMLAHPSIIRRPVLALPDGAILLGFDAETWARALPATGAHA